MATRQEIQIAQDLVKFVNIINDLLDCMSWQLQGIDPADGGVFKVFPPDARETGDVADMVEPTVDELKALITRTLSNIEGYRANIQDYLDRASQQKIVRGLNALGIDDAVAFQADLVSMKGACDFLQANIGAVTTKAQLAQLGQHIDNNVPKLELVRRNWAI